MAIRLKDYPHLMKLLSPQDQKETGIQPSHDKPQPKTDQAERDEQAQFANYCLLHQYPCVWHSTHKRSTGTVGCPDFIVGVNGVTLWIEFKREGGTLSDEQKEFGRKLETQGMRLYVVYSAGEAIELVNNCITPTNERSRPN
jgi:hypothetical protein